MRWDLTTESQCVVRTPRAALELGLPASLGARGRAGPTGRAPAPCDPTCNGPTDAQLLGDLANTSQVTAVGFEDNICFRPTHAGDRIDRREVGTGRKCSDKAAESTAVDEQGVKCKPKP